VARRHLSAESLAKTRSTILDGHDQPEEVRKRAAAG
jgi:hypothetical protein